jgi:hypothetical protein
MYPEMGFSKKPIRYRDFLCRRLQACHADDKSQTRSGGNAANEYF